MFVCLRRIGLSAYMFGVVLFSCSTLLLRNKSRLSDIVFALLTEGVTMIENKRPDWLLQYYKHCQKLIKVGSYDIVVPYSISRPTITVAKCTLCEFVGLGR